MTKRQIPSPQEIYDPLADSRAAMPSVAAELPEAAPRSPISGRVMETVQVGLRGQPNFAVWVDFMDRIVLPKRVK